MTFVAFCTKYFIVFQWPEKLFNFIFKMRRSKTKSHWGEFPETYEAKLEVDDIFSIYPPEKRARLEMLESIEEPLQTKS